MTRHSELVVDRRGQGDASEFESHGGCTDWETYKAYCDSGSLWVHAEKA